MSTSKHSFTHACIHKTYVHEYIHICKSFLYGLYDDFIKRYQENHICRFYPRVFRRKKGSMCYRSRSVRPSVCPSSALYHQLPLHY